MTLNNKNKLCIQKYIIHLISFYRHCGIIEKKYCFNKKIFKKMMFYKKYYLMFGFPNFSEMKKKKHTFYVVNVNIIRIKLFFVK